MLRTQIKQNKMCVCVCSTWWNDWLRLLVTNCGEFAKSCVCACSRLLSSEFLELYLVENLWFSLSVQSSYWNVACCALRSYGAKAFSLSKMLPAVCKLLEDANAPVSYKSELNKPVVRLCTVLMTSETYCCVTGTRCSYATASGHVQANRWAAEGGYHETGNTSVKVCTSHISCLTLPAANCSNVDSVAPAYLILFRK